MTDEEFDNFKHKLQAHTPFLHALFKIRLNSPSNRQKRYKLINNANNGELDLLLGLLYLLATSGKYQIPLEKRHEKKVRKKKLVPFLTTYFEGRHNYDKNLESSAGNKKDLLKKVSVWRYLLHNIFR